MYEYASSPRHKPKPIGLRTSGPWKYIWGIELTGEPKPSKHRNAIDDKELKWHSLVTSDNVTFEYDFIKMFSYNSLSGDFKRDFDTISYHATANTQSMLCKHSHVDLNCLQTLKFMTAEEYLGSSNGGHSNPKIQMPWVAPCLSARSVNFQVTLSFRGYFRNVSRPCAWHRPYPQTLK